MYHTATMSALIEVILIYISHILFCVCGDDVALVDSRTDDPILTSSSTGTS
jgi:hypothetical protein